MNPVQTPAPSGVQRLPASWSLERDLMVLYGPADVAARAAAALRSSGQLRLAHWPLERAGSEPPAQGLQRVESVEELIGLARGLPRPRALHVCLQPVPGQHVPDDLRRAVEEQVERPLIQDGINRHFVDVYGPEYAAQGLRNLGRIAACPTVSRLRDAFSGKPCVIVSPGPSLARNVDRLKALQDRALIMTCAHGVQALHAAGVDPDVVMAYHPTSLDWQLGGYDLSRTGALVLAGIAHPDQFELGARRIFTFGSFNHGWIYEGLDEAPTLATGGSVACTELSLALGMGCDPIVFVGQDLAIDGDRYYVDSVPDGVSRVEVSEDGGSCLVHHALADPSGAGRGWEQLKGYAPEILLEVPGWAGGTVRTTGSFKRFRDWFEAAAVTIGGSVRLVNCTEGGARIEGMEHVTLDETIASFADGPLGVEERLERALEGWDARTSNARMAKRARGYRTGLERCLAGARDCLRALRAIRAGKEELGPLQRAEAGLTRALEQTPFLPLMAQAEIREAQAAGSDASNLEENLAAAERLFRVVTERGAELREPLRLALDDLSAGCA